MTLMATSDWIKIIKGVHAKLGIKKPFENKIKEYSKTSTNVSTQQYFCFYTKIHIPHFSINKH